MSSVPPDPPPSDPRMGEVIVLRPALGSVLADRYQVMEPLAWGGQAFVYKGFDAVLQRHVALKVLRMPSRPKARARLRAEAWAASELSHPNLLPILDWHEGSPDDLRAPPFLVLPWIPGPTLAELLAERGPLVPEAVAMIGVLLCCGPLGLLHRHGVYHRDVKPSNVLIDREGRIFLIDLGVVSWPLGRLEQPPVTGPGERVGTLPYMSPEQTYGEAVDGRSDVFGVGVSLYELLTGGRPFGRPDDGEEEILAQIRAGQYQPLSRPEFPGYLRQAIDRALQVDKAARWPSIEALGQSLIVGLHCEGWGDFEQQLIDSFADPAGFAARVQAQLRGAARAVASDAVQVQLTDDKRALVLDVCRRARLLDAPDSAMPALSVTPESEESESESEPPQPEQELQPKPHARAGNRALVHTDPQRQVSAPLHKRSRQVPVLGRLLPWRVFRMAINGGEARAPGEGNGDGDPPRGRIKGVYGLMLLALVVLGGLCVRQWRLWRAEQRDPARSALARGHFAEALRLTAGVLERNPADAAALWTRGATLEKRTLTMTAAAMFERLVKQGQAEAQTQLAALRAMDEQVKHAWQELMKRGRAMIAGGPIPLDLVNLYPGYMRIFYYDAVRAASDTKRLEALRPLAEALDQQFGGTVLVDHLDRVQVGWSEERGRLARIYAKLAVDPATWSKPDIDRFLAALRQSKQSSDQILGTLLLTRSVGEHVTEYAELARATGDPWFELSAERAVADQERVQGKSDAAIQRLQGTLERCQELQLGYGCTQFELRLAVHYRRWNQLAEAHRHAYHGWQEAVAARDWETIAHFLWELRAIANAQGDTVFTKAYGEEAELRDPVGCYPQQLAQILRARAAQEAEDYETARREILTVPQCGAPLPILALDVKAHLQQAGFPTAPLDEIRNELYALRNRGGLSPAEELRSLEIEARLLLVDNPVQALVLFHEIVAQDEKFAASDVLARNALAAAYEELALDQGRQGNGAAAFDLLTRQWRLPRETVCAVGVVVTGQASLVLVRGPKGQISKPVYRSKRNAPTFDVAQLVPEELQAPLRQCAEVTVMAPPMLHGHATLLRGDLRWAFQSERYRAQPSEQAIWEQMAFAFVDARDESPLLGAWTVSPIRHSLLRGANATPRQVLQAMDMTSVMVFWAHGLFQEGRSALRLSPDTDGNPWLTAAAIQNRKVASARLVFLEQIPLATRFGALREPWSLATAFIEGGTEIVIASSQRGAAVNAAFARIWQDIRQGVPPAEAVWRERRAHGGVSESITVFQSTQPVSRRLP